MLGCCLVACPACSRQMPICRPVSTSADLPAYCRRRLAMLSHLHLLPGLVGDIIKRFEQRGYKLVGCKASRWVV